MRFLMFDRITAFEKNKRICGVKQIAQESGILEQINGELIYPPTLAIESLAQIGGWLVSGSQDFTGLVVLGMMVNARIFAPIYSGDGLMLRATAHTGYNTTSVAVVSGEIWRANECLIQIEKIAYGIFKMEDRQFIEEQQRLFTALFREEDDNAQ